LPDELLPPLPPGAKRLKDKKSFFSGLFGKKKQEPLASTIPAAAVTEPSQPPIEVPQDLNLEDIRKNLGLDIHEPETPAIPKLELEPELEEPGIFERKEEDLQPEFSFELPELEEPPKIEPKKKKKEEAQLEKPAFILPELDKPSMISGEEELLSSEKLSLEDELIEEPPRIIVEKKKIRAGKKERTREDVKEKEEPGIERFLPSESLDEGVEWAAEFKPKRLTPAKPEFLQEVKPTVEEAKEPPKQEFIKEVPPEEIKEFATGLKRKDFERKKGIKYEPEVSLAEEAEKEEEEEPLLIEESPQQEIDDIKKRLKESLSAGQKEEKPAEPSEGELSGADAKVRIDEITKAQINFPELIKAVEAKLADKIREEERSKLSEQYEQQIIELENMREKLEKERQAFEQQKIIVAGQTNKTVFKEKQLRKTEEELAMLREEFEKDKKEAEELLQKLPELRKDYENITARIQGRSDKLKEYEERKDQLKRVEEEIKRNEEALLEAQQRLIQTDERIKEKGFADYLETEIKTDTLVSPKFEEKDIIHATHLELYNKIDECKSLIRERNLAPAKSIYMELRDAYNSLQLEGAEKDMLYTVIREIYDDIKLAEIEGSGSDNVIY